MEMDQPIEMNDAPALCILELDHIARGYEAADLVVKKAPSRLLDIRPVCPGKVLLIFSGEEAAVQESYEAVLRRFESSLLDKLLILGVHPLLPRFLAGKEPEPILDGFAAIECRTAAAAVLAADRTLKAARIWPLEIRLAAGIGGRGFYTFTGALEELQTALASVRDFDALLDTALIPRPHDELQPFLLKEAAHALGAR